MHEYALKSYHLARVAYVKAAPIMSGAWVQAEPVTVWIVGWVEEGVGGDGAIEVVGGSAGGEDIRDCCGVKLGGEEGGAAI